MNLSMHKDLMIITKLLCVLSLQRVCLNVRVFPDAKNATPLVVNDSCDVVRSAHT